MSKRPGGSPELWSERDTNPDAIDAALRRVLHRRSAADQPASERAGIEAGQVQEIATGCVNVAHDGMGDIARCGALAAGFPNEVPVYTVAAILEHPMGARRGRA